MALSQIFSLVPVWHPACYRDVLASTILNGNEDLPYPDFPKFSVQELISQGNLLLASSGKEFAKPAGILSSTQEVKQARKDAMSRLGLGFLDGVEDDMDLDKEFAAEMEVDASAPVKLETAASSPMEICSELPVKERSPSAGSLTPNLPSPSTPNPPSEADTAALSARERNRLKRKRKPGNSAFVAPPPQASGARYAAAASGPAKSVNSQPVTVVSLTNIKYRARLINPDAKAASNSRLSSPTLGVAPDKVVIDPSKGGAIAPKSAKQSKALEVEDGVWVWDGVVKVLEVDLFSAAWEVRHGAAMALRELLKLQGKCGGMRG